VLPIVGALIVGIDKEETAGIEGAAGISDVADSVVEEDVAFTPSA
jgi:hypothetical protein